MDITELKITATVTIYGVNTERTDHLTGASIPTPWRKTLQVGSKINIAQDLPGGEGLGALVKLFGATMESKLKEVHELKTYFEEPEKVEEPA